MFTQCTNCQAIFHVSMREVTVSKGLLRCGECQEVFDSSKNLSTTMQDTFAEIDLKDKAKLQKLSVENQQSISALDDWQNIQTVTQNQNQNILKQISTEVPKSNPESAEKLTNKKKSQPFSTKGVEQNQSKSKKSTTKGTKLPLFIASLLVLLLISQVAFNYRYLFWNTLKYEPEKIQMLNHNVFAHPIEKNVLLISASIKNTADYDQPFPTLEVRLTNSKAELVALRRFSPDEYLDNYSSDILLTKNRATSIKLKIQDPGSQATRFQFDFL